MPVICCGSLVQNNETPGFYLHLEQIYSKKKSHKHPCSVLQNEAYTDRMYPFFSLDLFFGLIISPVGSNTMSDFNVNQTWKKSEIPKHKDS